MKNTSTYKSKGWMNFVYREDTIQCHKEDYPYYMEGMREVTICGDLMDGKKFYEHVDSGCIIDYDGGIGHVFVDGYDSNLGLSHAGLEQGGFLVDGETWLDICDEFTVEVEWCNR